MSIYEIIKDFSDIITAFIIAIGAYLGIKNYNNQKKIDESFITRENKRKMYADFLSVICEKASLMREMGFEKDHVFTTSKYNQLQAKMLLWANKDITKALADYNAATSMPLDHSERSEKLQESYFDLVEQMRKEVFLGNDNLDKETLKQAAPIRFE